MTPTVRTCLALLLLAPLPLAQWGCEADTISTANDTADATVDVAEADDGVDTYVAGLAKTGERFTVRLLESQPIPKDTGLYTWIVELVDADGEPVSGATIVAEPTMPAHGHGTFPLTTEATALSEDGRYQLTDMDLFMPGIWQVVLTIEGGDTTDQVMYHFDLEG